MKLTKAAVLCVLLLLLTLSLFAGCSRLGATPTEYPPCRVVTQIDIDYENGPIRTQRHYTASEKMRAILNYLRWIDPYGRPPADPETAAGSSFQIVLTYSDGCQKTYLQKADRYLLEEGKEWATIDPDRAQTLGRILGQMSSDSR